MDHFSIAGSLRHEIPDMTRTLTMDYHNSRHLAFRFPLLLIQGNSQGKNQGIIIEDLIIFLSYNFHESVQLMPSPVQPFTPRMNRI